MTYMPTAGLTGPFGAATRPRRERLLAWAVRRLRAALATSPYEPVEPDPIDHPVFRGMSPRELADLPFPRHPAAEAEARGPSAP